MKGRLRNAMEKARWVSGDYQIQFRNFSELVQTPIEEFWRIADLIPEHRIARVLENDSPIYESSNQALLALQVRLVPKIDPKLFRNSEETRGRSH